MYRPGRVESLRGVRRRHPDIRDDEVGPLSPDQGHQVDGIACLADNLETRTFEKAGNPFTKEYVIIGDYHPQGDHSDRVAAQPAWLYSKCRDVSGSRR
ncbi:hypothetical protein OKHIF_14490 [Mycobacteroides chelonae]